MSLANRKAKSNRRAKVQWLQQGRKSLLDHFHIFVKGNCVLFKVGKSINKSLSFEMKIVNTKKNLKYLKMVTFWWDKD